MHRHSLCICIQIMRNTSYAYLYKLWGIELMHIHTDNEDYINFTSVAYLSMRYALHIIGIFHCSYVTINAINACLDLIQFIHICISWFSGEGCKKNLRNIWLTSNRDLHCSVWGKLIYNLFCRLKSWNNAPKNFLRFSHICKITFDNRFS